VESRDIVIDLKLNVSSEESWKFWASSESLENWLTTKANIEPNVGGAYELFWDPSNLKDNSTLGCKITAFEPGKRLAFQWRGPVPFADLMNVEPLPTWVVVTFESVSPTQTLVKFRHGGWGEGSRWEAAKRWQMDAWAGAFKKLTSTTST